MKPDDRELKPKNQTRDLTPGEHPIRLIAHRDHEEGHTLMVGGWDSHKQHTVSVSRYEPDKKRLEILVSPPEFREGGGMQTAVEVSQEVLLQRVEDMFGIDMSHEQLAEGHRLSAHIAEDGSLCIRLPRKARVP